MIPLSPQEDLALAASPLRWGLATGWVPDGTWQSQLLASRARRLLVCSARQGGKSTTLALKVTHRAVYYPDSLILVTAKALRQGKELMRKITDLLGLLETSRPWLMGPPLETENRLELEFTHGSRIAILPGQGATIRGYSAPDMVVEDEAAFCPDELDVAMMPMLLRSGGQLIKATTPFGKRGRFWEDWDACYNKGSTDAETIFAPVDRCPTLWKDQLELAKMERILGRWAFRQEYWCEFVEAEDAFFSYSDIEGAMDQEVLPLFGPGAPPIEGPTVVTEKVQPLQMED